jgi:antitoxin CptB
MLARKPKGSNAEAIKACAKQAADIAYEGRYINPAPGTRRVFGVGAKHLNSGMDEPYAGPGITSDGLDARRRRLLFRAWHRGIREMDIVYGRFADAQIALLSEAELGEFERLLELRDQQVFDWVSGAQMPPSDYDTPLFRRLRDFHNTGTAIK